MNLIVIQRSIVIILFLVFHVKAQNDHRKKTIRPLHPSIAVIIGILSIMFSLTFLLLVFAKICLKTRTTHVSDEEQIPQAVLLQSGSRFSGIDRKVVESLPFFTFSSLKGSKEGLECAVCISKFEETETLRMLPRCGHAFHMACIDKWLESHSSCPLCRYKFNVDDLTSFPFSRSLRYPRNSCNLSEEPSLGIFVQREQSRCNMINLQRLAMVRKGDQKLLQSGKNVSHDRNQLHKFKHKIIVSDLICKSRWSDVNSSDLMLLNSEMLNIMSSKRFSPDKLISPRSPDDFHMNNEDVLKIKEDLESKRLYEEKVGKISNNSTSKRLDPSEKRSMSDIVHLSRYTDFSPQKDDKVRRLWMPIARRTVQWFAGRARDLK